MAGDWISVGARARLSEHLVKPPLDDLRDSVLEAGRLFVCGDPIQS